LQLKGTEVCIFVDGKPAYQTTDFNISDNSKALGIICADHVKSATIDNDELIITFEDNVVEYFKYIEELDAWKFDRKNTSVKIPYAHPN
jgi:hypothetical protein